MHAEVALNRLETQALSNILKPHFQSHGEQLQNLSSQMQELAQETKVQRTIHEHSISTPAASDYQLSPLASTQSNLSFLSGEAELFQSLPSCDCFVYTSRLLKTHNPVRTKHMS